MRIARLHLLLLTLFTLGLITSHIYNHPTIIMDQNHIDKINIIKRLGNNLELILNSEIYFYKTDTLALTPDMEVPNGIFEPANIISTLLKQRYDDKLGYLTDNAFVYFCNQKVYRAEDEYYLNKESGKTTRFVHLKYHDIYVKVFMRIDIKKLKRSCDIKNVTLLDLYLCQSSLE